ncbi:MAG: DMT family transporter [Desulfoplanes sp.]|nr:DMT family transporter [Desulfoplanes sp.]
MTHLGEITALATALAWAIGATLQARAAKDLGSLQLNLIRLPLTLALFGITLAVTATPLRFTTPSVLWLSLSGIIGLAVGDTFLYAGLTRIGARLGVLIFSFAPALTCLLGVLFLGETLTTTAILGIATTMTGILWVVMEKTPGAHHMSRSSSLPGVLLTAMATVCQAVGMIVVKKGLGSHGDPLLATTIRMVAATAVIWPTALVTGTAKNPLRLLSRHRKSIKYVIAGTLLGPFIGIWLSVIAVNLTQTGIAATLIATEPIFMIPVIFFLEKERPTLRGLAGTVIAVSGTVLIFLR